MSQSQSQRYCQEPEPEPCSKRSQIEVEVHRSSLVSLRFWKFKKEIESISKMKIQGKDQFQDGYQSKSISARWKSEKVLSSLSC
jgi:hypothetical protein